MKKKQLKFVRKTPYSRSKKDKDECDSGEESNYEVGGHDSDEGEFPLTCPICEADFIEPVVTKCRHFFCEGCALRNYSSDANCFVCGQATDGIFNTARDLITYLKTRPKVEIEEKETVEARGSGDE